ncbi:MAG: tRNA (adenosine(37)-N6)-threonylcarbamoyltransferase complex ATPase subunit type 1 TsaE [Acidobacteria bacterium]|nr:tRNA (adenosine(37)-N6)-threonylcarbamoyltransferase complex ATPase subunit type 1 TsaE [Acidobacteriota bacterium]
MVSRQVVTHSPEETIQVGCQLASQLTPPVLVLLIGELGAGKTTLAKGLIAGLGVASEDDVTSPTFTLIHEYGSVEGQGLRVYHVDLYRIETPRELETLGLEDLLTERAVVIVEWGERLGPFFRRAFPGKRMLEIYLATLNEMERQISVQAADRTEPPR